MVDALLNICNKIWQTGEWPTTWKQSLVITLPQKGNLQLCQKHHTINFVSHARKDCFLLLFNIFLEKIMTDALKDYKGSVSIGGRTITNLRFADLIDGKEEELFKLANQLGKASTTHGMEISAEKTKLMTNNTREISSDVRIGGQNLETVQSLKYLGSVMTDEGSKQEILSRIAQTVGAL